MNVSSKTSFQAELARVQMPSNFVAKALSPSAAVTAFVAATLLLLVGTPGLLRLAFAPMALCVGIFLFFRKPTAYLYFTYWLYFLTCLIRRLVDYRTEYTESSVMLIAPALVCMVSVLSFRKFPRKIEDGFLVVFIPIVTIFYGALIGITSLNQPLAVIKSFVGWITPMCFAGHVYLNWRQYPQFRRVIERVALGGLLVVGTYGIFQFVVAPEWDCIWLRAMAFDPASGPGVYGQAEPFGIRVFSTMNSHPPMAIVLVMLALIAATKQKRLYTFAAFVGMVAVLLSMARAAWLGAALSFVVFAFLARKPKILVNLGALIAMMLIAVFIFAATPAGEGLQQRLMSFTDRKQDISVGARQEGYAKGLSDSAEAPFGRGTGTMEVLYTPVINEDFGPHDSALLELVLVFGWLGATAFLLALTIGVLKIYQGCKYTKDIFLTGICGSVVSVLVQSPLNSCLDGVQGVFFWSLLALGLASIQYSKQTVYASSKEQAPQDSKLSSAIVSYGSRPQPAI